MDHRRGGRRRLALHDRGHHRELHQRRHVPGGRARPAADPVRLPAGLRPRRADRPRPAGGEPGDPADRRTSGRATSGTRCRTARASRSTPCRWPACTRRSPTTASGCSRRSSQARTTRAASTPRPRRRRPGGSSSRRRRKELIQILQQVPGLDEEANAAVGRHPRLRGRGQDRHRDSRSRVPRSNPLCSHGSSYIGMAPGNGPQVVVAGNVQNPRQQHRLLRRQRRGPGLLQRDELRPADAADPAATRTSRTVCPAQCALILDTLGA